MEFERIDDIDEDEDRRVTYSLINFPSMFEIQATRKGVRLTGTTPHYSDWTPVQKYLNFAQYQSQRLKETGSPILQRILEEGGL
jgi:hypothetical protein